jgi:hypothetical protein
MPDICLPSLAGGRRWPAGPDEGSYGLRLPSSGVALLRHPLPQAGEGKQVQLP